MSTNHALKIAVTAVVLVLCGAAEDLRKTAPPFPELAKDKGKVVLLNFWETTCGACKLEIPWLMEFEKQFKASGFTVLGVALDEAGWKSVRPFIRQKKLNYPVMIGSNDFADQYKVAALPMTFLIDRQGRIAAEHTGLLDRAQFEKEIRRLLDEH